MAKNEETRNLLVQQRVNEHELTLDKAHLTELKSPSQDCLTESNIPSRFKRSSFQRFEPVLEQYTGRHPVELLVVPNDLTFETFTCRLRDAVNALKRNELWNPMLFRFVTEVWDGVTVSHDGKAVRIGPRVTKQSKSEYQVVQSTSSLIQLTNEVVLRPTPARFDAVAKLLSLLDGEMQVRFSKTLLANSFLTSTLINHPNIEAFQDGEDVILL